MKQNDVFSVIWRTASVVLLVAILICGYFIYKKVEICCEHSNQKQAVLILRTTEVYDSLNHKKGKEVWIDTLTFGQDGSSSIVIWNDCPEKVIAKRVHKKFIPVIPSIEVKKNEVPKLEIVPSVNVLSEPSVPVLPDTLKLTLESFSLNKDSTKGSTKLLYSITASLPTSYQYGLANKTDLSFDIGKRIHVEEYNRRAKRVLWTGIGVTALGASAYAITHTINVPTFVNYNGLEFFDPANKYYDRNVHERSRLRTLKWVRGASVGVAVLGGIEVVHGVLLIKNVDFDLAPQKLTLKYKF